MKYLTPVPKQFVDSSGVPYSNGTVSVYYSGTEELAEIWLDADGESLSPNPAKLDSHGSWICYVNGGEALDYIVQDKDGHVVAPFEKVVPGGGDGGGQVYNAGEGIKIDHNTISLEYLSVNNSGEVCITYDED